MFNSAFTLSAMMALASFPSLGRARPTIMTPVKRDDTLKFSYGSEKVRGVNLGGWLVLEPWITPELFAPLPDDVVDEWTLGQYLGHDAAYDVLKPHWDSWITQEDIQNIANAGLNHVRLPVGYWAVKENSGDDYVSGAYPYVGKALDWAQAAGIKVMIDLHGAPLSQNGFDNSGRRGTAGWGQGDSVSQTEAVLNKIRDDHASHPACAAIELLNEPLGGTIDVDTIKQFYMDGWGNLENSNVAITFHDAFQGVTSWNDWGSGMWNLLLDTHHYEVFDTGSLGLSTSEHVSTACGFGGQMASNNKWTIAGEWTGAMTDCAKWLNGRGVGARYDGTFNYNGQSYTTVMGSCDGFYSGTVAALSSQDKTNIRQFIEAQLDAFEEAAGWIWWTWKTQGAPEWDMQDLINNGVFPQPLTSRKYPGQCG